MLLDAKVIKNYTDSLYSLCKDQKNELVVLKELEAFNIILKDGNIKKTILSPIISEDKKSNVVNEIAKKNNLSEITNKFLCTLIHNSRMDMLGHIISKFEKFYKEDQGIKLVTVSSAASLSKKEKEMIIKYLENKIGKKIEINLLTDLSLIGGAVISYDDQLLNFSILGAISTIENNLCKQKI